MVRLVLSIYDFFRKSHASAWCLFTGMTLVMVLLVLRLSYKEDITDFLPLDEQNHTAMSVYQDVSGANRIYAIISGRDDREVSPDRLVEGVESFVSNVEHADTAGYISRTVKEIDMEQMLDITDRVYSGIPYFLTDRDYTRIDSLLQDPTYVERQLQNDKEMLMFPSSNMIGGNISRDPLNLFSPVPGRLRRGGMDIDFETYDGYLLSPDSRKAVVMMESGFGAHESEHNAELVEMLQNAAEQSERSIADIDIHIIGGPVIAVTNASRIKTDSITAVCIAGVLIVLLLIYVFRSVRNILLIIASVSWGWLFALAAIALYYDSVSIIVIGIASVIIGIAVNYPLHLIDHLRESRYTRTALREIVSPLVIGNVTTVGAFLCLVPLKAPALHDLGLFSSLLLVGTILFVLLFLPHVVKTDPRRAADPVLITGIADRNIENKPWIVWSVLALTIFFAVFSFRTEFDSDMRNINYMTQEQKQDMDYFQSLVTEWKNVENLYVVSSGKGWDEAMRNNERISRTIDSLQDAGIVRKLSNVTDFLSSEEMQRHKLEKWNEFKTKYGDRLITELRSGATKVGFSPDAFTDFEEILATDYQPQEPAEMEWLTSSVFMGNISKDEESGRHSIVQTLEVDTEKAEDVRETISSDREFGGICFDVKSMNGSMANTLSDDFNYIGIACGLIVFIFLWLSLGSIELAIMSFLPMAVSWIWILGIMGLLGIKFNIVNIILATFIFGQGDDYTIFMTEGLSYELAYRKRLLGSYKSSIMVSALIMFIGIGTLVFAHHPALRSLGQVTVVGMLSVVLMAYLFPPLVFNWLVRKNGRLRAHPLTLRLICRRILHLPSLLSKRNSERNSNRETAETGSSEKFGDLLRKGISDKELLFYVDGRYLYKGIDIERKARKALKKIAPRLAELRNMTATDTIVVVENKGQGELTLALAMLHPDKTIISHLTNHNSEQILKGAMYQLVDNIRTVDHGELGKWPAEAIVSDEK